MSASVYSNLFANYSFFYDLPDTSTIGGIGIFIRTNLNPVLRQDLKIKSYTNLRIENLWFEVTSASNNKYIIGGLYRHPNQPIPIFNDALSDVLDLIPNKHCIIAGDINTDLLKFDINVPTILNTSTLY